MSVVPTRLTRIAAVGVLTALVLASGVPAYADHHVKPNISVSPDGSHSGTFTGTTTTTHTTHGTSGSSGSGYTGTGYTGTGSSSGSGATGEDGETGVRMECGAYLGSTFVHSACPTDQASAAAKVGRRAARPQVTTEMVTEAARVTAPTSPPHVEPGTVSYVNIPNNYWTESPTVRDSVTVVGQTIPLVWTPTSTTWDFGDGGSATGDGVEGADVGAPGAVEHSYARQGSYDISTTTTYNLTFVLPGQGTQTITLTAPPSPPVTLPVREIQTLVDFTR
jgi:hypothetical protein